MFYFQIGGLFSEVHSFNFKTQKEKQCLQEIKIVPKYDSPVSFLCTDSFFFSPVR